jgi:hypothetical protein
MMTVKDEWEGLGKEAAFTEIFSYILAVLQWGSERPLSQYRGKDSKKGPPEWKEGIRPRYSVY